MCEKDKEFLKKRIKVVAKQMVIFFVAIAIPALLILHVFQSNYFYKNTDELNQLDEQQKDLLERNKQLISDISVLRSYERIEKIATEELDMHYADTDEIIRVKIKAD